MTCWHLNIKGQKCRNEVSGTAASSTPSIWRAHSLECSAIIWGLIPVSVPHPPHPPTLTLPQISLCLFIGCHWSLTLLNSADVCTCLCCGRLVIQEFCYNAIDGSLKRKQWGCLSHCPTSVSGNITCNTVLNLNKVWTLVFLMDTLVHFLFWTAWGKKLPLQTSYDWFMFPNGLKVRLERSG